MCSLCDLHCISFVCTTPMVPENFNLEPLFMLLLFCSYASTALLILIGGNRTLSGPVLNPIYTCNYTEKSWTNAAKY